MKKLLIALIILFFLSSNAQVINTVAGNGVPGYTGNGGQATMAEIHGPAAVTFDAAGNLYIADQTNNLVRKVSTSGIITTVAGGGSSGLGDGGPATNAQLLSPTGVAFDATGNLYIADQYTYRIRMVNTSGIITTVAGNGNASYSGDGGPATAASLFNPTSISFDVSGNLYIADYSNNCIRMVNTAGIISTFAGNGSATFSGDGGQAISAGFSGPVGVAFDLAGNLLIADRNNNRIRRVNTSGIVTTIAGNGIASYSGDCGFATAAEINGPFGVTPDGAGNFYIADLINNRVRKVTMAGIITTVAGNGTGTYSGDGGPAINAGLYQVAGVTLNTIGDLYVADFGNNRVRLINNSNTTILTVNSPSICAGSTTTLTAGGANTYTWNTGANTNSIVVNPSSTTNYTVTGNINTCISQTVVATVVVTSGANVTVNGNVPICSGKNITLTASGANSYIWSTGATTAAVTLTPTTTTTYTVIGSVGTCTTQAVVTVTVNPSPIPIITGNTDICQGQNTSLTASGSTSYSWNTGATTANIVLSPLSTTNYTVIGTTGTCTNQAIATVSVTPNPTVSITGNLSVCMGNQTTLTASGASNYSWSTGALTTALNVNPVIYTTYTVIGAVGTCTGQAVASVSVNPAPVVSVTGNTVVCLGQNTALTAVGANTYTWNTGPTTAGIVVSPSLNTTYSVIGTIGTCTNQATVNIITSNITMTGNNMICQGKNTALIAHGAANYLWSTGSTTSSIVVSPTVTTTYTVIGTTGTCTTQAVDTVFVNSIPYISIVGDTVICSGQSTSLTASGASTYIWSDGSAMPSITISPKVTTHYYVIGTTGSCTFQAVETVYVNTSPKAGYIMNPNPANTLSPLVNFTNQSTYYTHWWWNFGDGSPEDSTDINPIHYYDTEAGGSYLTSLSLINQYGCKDEIEIILVIEPEFSFFMPNTFTPNNDGRNEFFTGVGTGIESYEMWIFDRWGSCIYTSNDINKGWDGKLKNASEPAQQDIYVWKVEIKDKPGKKHQYSGTVTLMK